MSMIQQQIAAEMRCLVREAAQPVAAGESIKGQVRRAWVTLGRPDFWRVRAAWHGEAGKWLASAVEDFRDRARRLEASKARADAETDAASLSRAAAALERRGDAAGGKDAETLRRLADVLRDLAGNG